MIEQLKQNALELFDKEVGELTDQELGGHLEYVAHRALQLEETIAATHARITSAPELVEEHAGRVQAQLDVDKRQKEVHEARLTALTDEWNMRMGKKGPQETH